MGAALVSVGILARRDVARTLAQERVLSGRDSKRPDTPVTTAAAARSMSELIRAKTIEATGGRTYAETDPYLDPRGDPTADAARAGKDERAGEPLENPEHRLWIQSTTLQTALTQAYVAFRTSELTIGLGVSFLVVGIGLAAAGRTVAGRQR